MVVGEFGEVYLLDWGVAVELDDGVSHSVETFWHLPRFNRARNVHLESR